MLDIHELIKKKLLILDFIPELFINFYQQIIYGLLIFSLFIYQTNFFIISYYYFNFHDFIGFALYFTKKGMKEITPCFCPYLDFVDLFCGERPRLPKPICMFILEYAGLCGRARRSSYFVVWS